MKATATRKTYYALGLAAAACGMAAALAGAAGELLSPLESLSFALTGMMFLLLAAVKGSDPKEKRRYFACFLVTLAGNVQLGLPLVNFICLALPWPMLAVFEEKRGAALARQTRLLVFAEGMAMVTRVMLGYNIGGFGAVGWLYYMMEALAGAARGWLAMTLYRLAEKEEEP